MQLLDFRHMATRLSYACAGWVAPQQPLLLDTLARASFIRSWEGSILMYTQEHDPAGSSQ